MRLLELVQLDRAGGQVTLARPHDLHLHSEPVPGAWAGVITRIHVVGPEARVDVTRSDQSGSVEVYLPKTQLSGASVGQSVYLTAERQAILPEG